MRIPKHYANIVSTVALVVALTGVGAYAAGKIGPKQIKKAAVRKKHIKKNAVRTKHIKDESVIPAKVQFPAARQVGVGSFAGGQTSARAAVGGSFQLLAIMGSYEKTDPSSALEVTWTGTAKAGFSPCIFQLRVDGQAAAGNGAAVYVQNSLTTSVSAQGLFPGLGTGVHNVQVYARAIIPGHNCEVGPASAQVPQTVNAAELV